MMVTTSTFISHIQPGQLSAMDLLSEAKLVNYFGTSKSVDDIKISPILIQKGTTKVRLNRTAENTHACTHV